MRAALTMRVTEASGYRERRDSISHDWVERLNSWAVTPVFVPNKLSDPVYYFRGLAADVLVLTGGDDIGTTTDRDATENALLAHALHHNIPVFGVCRGMQLINQYLGGTLTPIDGHIGASHKVSFSAKWQPLYGNETIVNSYHGLGIAREELAPTLRGFAWDDDGFVEAFHHKDLPVIAVMWHPERDAPLTGDERILHKLSNKETFWR